MKTHGFLAFAVLLIGLATATPTTAATSIDVTASNWKFSPATITTKVGEATTLHLTSTEGVHGIASPELGIASTMMVPKKTVTVTFTPKKAGTYKVPCSIVCGAGHATMILTVVVAP